jgi:hypothetical protein
MDQNSSKNNSRPGGQETPCHLCSPKAACCKRKQQQQPHPTMSTFNPLHIPTPCFFKIHFTSSARPCLSLSQLVCLRLHTKIQYTFRICFMRATCPPLSPSFIWSLTTSGEEFKLCVSSPCNFLPPTSTYSFVGSKQSPQNPDLKHPQSTPFL